MCIRDSDCVESHLKSPINGKDTRRETTSNVYPTIIFPSGRTAPLLCARLIAMASAKEIGPTRPINMVKQSTNFEIALKEGVNPAVSPTVPNAEVASNSASMALMGCALVERMTPVVQTTTRIATVTMARERYPVPFSTRRWCKVVSCLLYTSRRVHHVDRSGRTAALCSNHCSVRTSLGWARLMGNRNLLPSKAAFLLGPPGFSGRQPGKREHQINLLIPFLFHLP